MRAAAKTQRLTDTVSEVVANFTEWLDVYGEKSWDYQSFLPAR